MDNFNISGRLVLVLHFVEPGKAYHGEVWLVRPNELDAENVFVVGPVQVMIAMADSASSVTTPRPFASMQTCGHQFSRRSLSLPNRVSPGVMDTWVFVLGPRRRTRSVAKRVQAPFLMGNGLSEIASRTELFPVDWSPQTGLTHLARKPIAQPSINESKNKRLQETCERMLHRQGFLNWQAPSTSDKLLWIKGRTGFGKMVPCARLI
jgi:hypothetical protein